MLIYRDKLLAYRENKDSYKKRSFRHRWNEAKCRYRNFKALGILLPKGWIYVLRPIAACAIPYWLLAWYKRKESSIQQNRYWNGEKDYEEKRAVMALIALSLATQLTACKADNEKVASTEYEQMINLNNDGEMTILKQRLSRK